MSVRQIFIVALANGLPRAFGVLAIVSGLFRIGAAMHRGKHAGTPAQAISGGARTALAGALLSCEAVGAVYFAIAALGYGWADTGATAPDCRQRMNDWPT
ncbi:hypothetical protein [Burkholderia sp. AU16741]|uniref:hypothetical protein n=1 Tax=Burkholderia sp. AU16741 TaxID=2015347 RepID=UPI00211B29E4|nr:hypothetical protein [Burkholderia sp. AU16741]